LLQGKEITFRPESSPKAPPTRSIPVLKKIATSAPIASNKERGTLTPAVVRILKRSKTPLRKPMKITATHRSKARLDVATPLRHKDGRRFEVSLRQKRNEGLNDQRPSKHLRDPGADRTVSSNPTNRVISSFSRKLQSRPLRSIRYRLDGPKARKSKSQIFVLCSCQRFRLTEVVCDYLDRRHSSASFSLAGTPRSNGS
jgi:hypothetical protein